MLGRARLRISARADGGQVSAVGTTPEQFLPHPTPESAFFWDGLRDGVLLLPYCTACDHYFFPPMPGCPQCGADLDHVEHRPASGSGHLYSWIVAHYAFDPYFAAETPYAVVTVTLSEGPRIYGRWLGDENELAPELDVVAEVFERDGVALLGFRPRNRGVA